VIAKSSEGHWRKRQQFGRQQSTFVGKSEERKTIRRRGSSWRIRVEKA
jgi:hypothetical protein